MKLKRRGVMSLVGAITTGVGVFQNAFAETTTPAGGAAADACGEPVIDMRNNPKLPWPERGCFGGKAVVGPHQPNAAAMLSEAPLMGLTRESSFIYGNVRDEQDNLYEIVRGLPERPHCLSALFVQSNTGKDTLHIDPDAMKAATSSKGFEAALVDGNAVWKSKAGIQGNPFEITMSADGSTVTWKEEGLFELSGTLLGPGMQWCIPDRDGSELYVSQIYNMSGQYMGRAVRGLLPFDSAYLPEGQLQYSGKDPLFRPKIHHRCWYTWATLYKDGTYEAAHFVLGTDRLGFAVHTNERHDMMMVTDITGDITIIPQGTWPARITLKAADTEWEFLPDPRGRMPDLLGGVIQSTTPQNEGRWRRVGDQREPDVWCAWGEVAPPGRTNYMQVYRS